MFIVKMISKTHPKFEFKSTSDTKEEAIKNAFNTLDQLGNLRSVYEVEEVIESSD